MRKVKFRRKSNGEILVFDSEKDKDQIKTLRMSKKFQQLMNL
jgi:hypothetical protein